MLVRLSNFLNIIFIIFFLSAISFSVLAEEKNARLIKKNWSFDGVFGTFDRSSLQRGFQVYQEVCSGCHSVQHLSYRNLAESGGPEFSKAEAKAIAAQFEITDGPNSDGEMFIRPGKYLINLSCLTLTLKLQQQLMEEHIRQICQCLQKQEQVALTIYIHF